MNKKLLLISIILCIFFLVMANTSDSNYKIRLQTDDGKTSTVTPKNALNGTKGILYSQMPDTISGAGLASQYDTLYPFRADLVDDIIADVGGWSVDSIVTWWSNWNGFASWDSIGLVTIAFFEDSGAVTMPKNDPYYEIDIDSSDFTATAWDRLTLRLDPPLLFPEGERVWMAILPVNIYSTNGQTGIITGPSIGNGQEVFLKAPVLGYNTFTSATAIWGTPNEYGIILYGDVADTVYDAGVTNIESPAEDILQRGDYPVKTTISNLGNMPITFYAKTVIYDTTDLWNVVFYDSIEFTDMATGADTVCSLGVVTFEDERIYYTEIFTNPIVPPGTDDNPGNDTMSVYSRTTAAFGDIIFEMDAETLTGDNNLLGIEFDGEYFYITGGNAGTDPNKVYVIDTLGNLIWSMDQPAHATSWGWRDIAWDGVRRDSLRIDTLYASVNDSVDKFGIDLVTGTLDYYGAFPGPQNPNRALAYNEAEGYFYTGNFTSGIFKFNKDSVLVDSTFTDSLSKYGAAFDSDSLEGNCLWFHTQDMGGLYIAQYDKDSLTETGTAFSYLPSGITSGIAGGLCYTDQFRSSDVLFALAQGTPHDYIVGIFLRTNLILGIEDEITDIKQLDNELLISNGVNRGNMYFMLTGNKIHDVSIMSVDGRVIKEYSSVNPGTLISFGNGNTSGVYFIKVKGTEISKKFTLMK